LDEVDQRVVINPAPVSLIGSYAYTPPSRNFIEVLRLQLVRVVVASAMGMAACRTPRETTPLIHVDSGTVAVNGTTLYYEAAGQGPVVVLLHAGNLDHRVWDPQFLPLARDHRVIRYDLRGYGRSGPADAPYAAHDDLSALLDALRVRQASLVGLSGGGRIAIDFALAHPERVDRLVLASTGLSGWRYAAGDTAYFPEARRARDRGDAAALGIAWLGSAYTRPAMEHSELITPLRAMAADNGKVWMNVLKRGDLERVADPPALHRTAALHVPTLLVVGTRDTPDIRAIADTLATSVAGIRRVEFEGAGHLVNMEQPQRFTELLRAFLRP
jgi:pimeloyl-ACP methyl ester carboxylesterase